MNQHLTIIVREIFADGAVAEVRIYQDNWIEMFFGGYFLKGYYYETLAA